MKFLLTELSIILKAHPFESLFGLPVVLLLGWYALAVTGIFYPPFVIFLLLSAGLGGIICIARKPAFCNRENGFLIIFLLFFAVIAFSSHPLEPVAEGRDQGTFALSALLLENAHGLPFTIPEAKPFFALYGPGKALNFPGLAYTETGNLVPEFPLGYIVWLAGFVTTFGIFGFSLANACLSILSGLLFFALAKRALSSFWAFIATLVTFGGFLPLWFLSFTLSENLALFLFLLTAEGLLRYRFTKDTLTLFLVLTSSLTLALTRIEGWAIFILTLAIATFQKEKVPWIREVFFQKPFLGLWWLLLTGFLVLETFLINIPYYKAIAKALLKNIHQNIQTGNIRSEALPLYHILFEYGLLLPFVFGLLACLFLWKTRRISLLIPFFLALPTLPYLLLPHITLDAPWMLRRFLFSLYPTLILSSLWAIQALLAHWHIKKRTAVWILFFAIVLGGQIPAMVQFSATSYSDTLTPQIQTFATNFTPEDLLLIDREATGDNFMMLPRALSLLSERPAVYFFNPHDFATLDTSAYHRVFLVTPETKLAWYTENLTKPFVVQGHFTFTNTHSFRTQSASLSPLPKPTTLTQSVVIVEIQ